MKKTFALAVAFLLCTGCQKQDTNDDLLLLLAVAASDPRNNAINDYYNGYLNTRVPDNGWNGAVTGCQPGSVTQEAIDRVAARISYFRRRAGVRDVVVIRPEWNTKAQKAALMMKAENALSHYPGTGWSCYSADGAEAAARSNLALGTSSARSISAYIQDNGSGNYYVGHRRWILSSRVQEFGTGSTDSSNALWVVPDDYAPQFLAREFVAWPPADFVPRQVVYPRWSFSIPDADFSASTVTMQDPAGQTLSVSLETLNNGAGDNTLVWVPAGIDLSAGEDRPYQVTVRNVVINGGSRDFSYTVTIIDPPDQGGTGVDLGTATWGSTQPNSFSTEKLENARASILCPAGGSPTGNVWGTNPYHPGSDVCTAAVHAGKINATSGGLVTFLWTETIDDYPGSSQNGVTSFSTGSSGQGFRFP